MREIRVLIFGQRARLAVAVAMGVGAIVSSIGLLGTAAYLISSASLLPPILDLSTAIVGVRFFGISRGVFRYAERIAAHDLSLRISASLRERMATALTQLIPGRLAETHTGDLLQRIISDADAWQHVITRVLLPPTVALIVVIGVFVLGLLLLPAVGLILLLSLLVAGVALPWFANRLGRWSEETVADDRRRLAESVVEMIDGAEEISAYGQGEVFLDELSSIEGQLERKARRAAWVSGFNDAALLIIVGATELSILGVAVPAVLDGRLRGTQLAVVAMLGLVSFEAVQDLPRAFQQLGASLESVRRVEAVVALPTPDEPADEQLPMPGHPHLTLSGLSLTYATRPRPVLNNFDLDIPYGSRIAIRGDNGAGKTSLAYVLLRFREPDSGSYLIDGMPAGRFAAGDVRARIGMIDDRAYVFSDTVRANLEIGNPAAGMPQLVAACERVGLGPWLARLPEGLDTVVSAAAMSGGERRRLAVARALLSDFAVLILDEPTAGLDPNTAALVMGDILRATDGKTVLLITHRSEGVAAMDRVATMVDGAISSWQGG